VEFHAPLKSSPPLERVRMLLRERVPRLEDDRYFAADISLAAHMVRNGALVPAAEVDCLPTVGS
jgi:histidine ammonia-lyase